VISERGNFVWLSVSYVVRGKAKGFVQPFTMPSAQPVAALIG
jgi:hypothetical protein